MCLHAHRSPLSGIVQLSNVSFVAAITEKNKKGLSVYIWLSEKKLQKDAKTAATVKFQICTW